MEEKNNDSKKSNTQSTNSFGEIILFAIVFLAIYLVLIQSCEEKSKKSSYTPTNKSTYSYSYEDSTKKSQKSAIEKLKEQAKEDGMNCFDSGYTFDCLFSAAKKYLSDNYNESVYDTSCLGGMISLSKYDFMGYTKSGKYFYMTIDHDTNSTPGVWKVDSCTVASSK